jgi:hypothetical protein
MDREKLTDTIVDFLREIGLSISERPLSDDTFLPGIRIEAGSILFDRTRLTFPGDLLHEAGHLAIVPAATRKTLSDKVQTARQDENVLEAAAMTWSYAATLHLGIDPQTVFHPDGYRGKAAAILLGFDLGLFIGLPVLEAAQMTIGPKNSDQPFAKPFPAMIKWLRN